MKQTKPSFTPGPCHSDGDSIIRVDTVEPIAEVVDRNFGPLLSAAPEMYEALTAILARLDLQEQETPGQQYMLAAIRNDIRKLLSKARGEVDDE